MFKYKDYRRYAKGFSNFAYALKYLNLWNIKLSVSNQEREE